MIKAMVEDNSGNHDDANDVFQEAVILLYRKINNETFELTSSFKTYLYSICWHIWMKELRDRNVKNDKLEEYKHLENNPENIDVEYELHRRYKLYQEHFKQLPSDCQKILKMALDKIPAKKIAKKMGLKGEKYVKKRKYICKKTLVDSIKNDKRYKDNYEGY